MLLFLLGQEVFGQTGNFTLSCATQTLVYSAPNHTSFIVSTSENNLFNVTIPASTTIHATTASQTWSLVLNLESIVQLDPSCVLSCGTESVFKPEGFVERVAVSTQTNEPCDENTKCLILDYCERGCNTCFQRQLENLNLKKGDFFTLKIKGINPFTHSLKVTTKNDTFKVGEEPAIFAEFMDVGKLSSLAANIKSIDVSPVRADFDEKLENAKTANEKKIISKGIEEFMKISNDSIMNLSRKIKSDTSISKTSIKREVSGLSDKKMADFTLNTLTQSFEVLSKKKKIELLTDAIEDSVASVYNCYINSTLQLYRNQIDCGGQINVICFPSYSCECLGNTSSHISYIQRKKRTLLGLISSELSNENLDAELKKQYEKLLKELQSELYYNNYFTKIHAKTYTNFLVANNMQLISEYYSFPIQVQGDELELKIDIVPRSKAGGSEEKKKEEEKKSENSQSVNVDNNSPVTINITTASVTASTRSSDNSGSTGHGEGENTASKDKINETELDINMFNHGFEWHLNYKYRINRAFYGFGSGFFVDNLGDEQYVVQVADFVNPSKGYKIVAEDNNNKNNQDIVRFGIMGSVNIGVYPFRKYNFFLQLFSGPGLSIENKLKPRLLIGGGLGFGEGNKFSLNGGVSIGQVRYLSKSLSTEANYTTAPEIKYFNTTKAGAFVSISYIFDLRKKKEAKGEEKKEDGESKENGTK